VHRTGAAAARTWAGRARHAADRAGGRGHGGRRARPSYLRRRAEAGARARRRGSVGWVGPRLGERPLDPAWVAGFGSLSHKGWMCYVVCTGGNGDETTSSVLSPTCVTNLLKATILFLFIIYIYYIHQRESTTRIWDGGADPNGCSAKCTEQCVVGVRACTPGRSTSSRGAS